MLHSSQCSQNIRTFETSLSEDLEHLKSRLMERVAPIPGDRVKMRGFIAVKRGGKPVGLATTG